VKSEIKDYVVNELLNGRNIGDADDLLLSGLVESLGVMRLVAHLEQRFDVRIPPQDITIEHFANIDAIHRYLEGRLDQ
jgi:acyl carrier protein